MRTRLAATVLRQSCNSGYQTKLLSRPSLILIPKQAHLSTVKSSPKRTHSYVHGASNIPLLSTTLGELVDQQAEALPDRELFVVRHQNIRRTFAQFKVDVDKFASGLCQLGLNRGDRVGIWGPNSYEWLVTQYATAKAGFILVLVNPAYKTHELEYCLNKVQIKALVTAEGVKSQLYYPMLEELSPGLREGKPKSTRVPHLEHIIMISEEQHAGAHRMKDVYEMGTADSLRQYEQNSRKTQFDDAVNIQFTSGTTGNPKGATLTHHNIVNNGYFHGRRLDYHNQPDTKICCPVPMYHCFGCVLGSISAVVHGVSMVIPAGKFDPEATLQAIHDEKCTALYGVPTMFSDQLSHPNFDQYDTRSLRSAFMSGAPCPTELLKQVQEGMHVKHTIVGYGSTETSPLSHVSFLEDPPECTIHTVGTAIDHVEVKLVDEEDFIVPVGTRGEILVRGHNRMKGYWEDEAKTKEAISPTGWMRSGDIGIMNEMGYLRIVGRSKDTIIRGGENVYPAEIENVLHTHPAIVEAYVVGVPDKRLGEEICCWAKLRSPVSETDLQQFCKSELANFKVPKYFIFLSPEESFPLTVTGKVQKFLMREESVKKLKLEGVMDAFEAA
ncbi:Acyl-CoA synthetase family member 2, mitochondrial [Hypsibius exemplaris]|uniref:Medium-chain acyl-CoA ligase ACSF2, mitochondrial n=1 Tax=Hypsibius exemplaris TaxID=2072580 RepID=A0A1W0WHF8_HYPEX|nr:Acyl-CoA synthetase family member 2, mitochondrial [Hypsibius exemplaris]